VASAYVSGALPWLVMPAGQIGVVLGLEYRTEEARSVYDELSAAGATFQNAVAPFLPPDLTVQEVFAELRVPLLRDRPMVEDLSLETAGRLSRYDSATGSVSAYNLGFVYSPVPELDLRVNYSTSVRAPTQGDLYRPPSQDFALLKDPCDVLNLTDIREVNCAAHGLPPDFVNATAREQSTGFVQRGNPQLAEEEGKSFTVGARYTPEFVPGFSMALDYYDFDVANLISPPSAQAILNACYDSPTGVDNKYCAVIRRKRNGEFRSPALIAKSFNYARQVTEGLDLDAVYSRELRNGHQLNVRALATWVFELTNYLDLEEPSFADRVLSELGDPDLSLGLELNYALGNLTLGYRLRYFAPQTIGFYEEQHAFNGNPPTDADLYPRTWYPSELLHGIRGDYAVTERVSLYAGVDNLTDSLPPLGLLGDAPGEPFDSVGRYFYGGLMADF
jgi:outer membrane receptor protein involved in Fe transport